MYSLVFNMINIYLNKKYLEVFSNKQQYFDLLLILTENVFQGNI